MLKRLKKNRKNASLYDDNLDEANIDFLAGLEEMESRQKKAAQLNTLQDLSETPLQVPTRRSRRIKTRGYKKKLHKQKSMLKAFGDIPQDQEHQEDILSIDSDEARLMKRIATQKKSAKGGNKELF